MIVLDSSFLIACHNARDVHHAAATQVMRRFLEEEWGRGLLLEYVFLETVTVIRARLGLPKASAVAQLLLQASETEFVPCSDFFAETLDGFRQQQSGALSFTDAAIVHVARKRADGLVASFDTDFRAVEGIEVVPAAAQS
jgi:predicted nucleic acid-binding protein